MYSSTSSAYGLNNYPNYETDSNDCLNPYSVSKVAGEELCKLYTNLYDLKTVIFRYFNVYGERSPTTGQYAPVIGIFLRQKNLILEISEKVVLLLYKQQFLSIKHHLEIVI